MKRRPFVALLAAAALSPLAMAQQRDRERRIGVLIPYAEDDAETRVHLRAFREELKKRGWIEGGNLRIDHGWAAGGDTKRLVASAQRLAQTHPDAILVRSTAATRAILSETRAIPVVFVVVSDPLGDGFVASMARPGGNATGFTNVESSIATQWLQLLKEIDPRVQRVLVVYGSTTAAAGGSYYLRLLREATRSIPVQLVTSPVEDAGGIERAMRAFAAEPRGGMLVLPDATTTVNRSVLVAQAEALALPAVYPFNYFARSGGLLSYGVDVVDQYRQSAAYIDRILRGERPAELPVQGPTKFELVLNVKAAKALGLSVPPSIMLRADQLVE